MQIGDKLYMRQRTGNYYVDLVKNPYTVTKIISDNQIEVQACRLVFYGNRYFDTLPDEIHADPNGEKKILKKSRSKRFNNEFIYKDSPSDTYPEVAVFGTWEYYPYLN